MDTDPAPDPDPHFFANERKNVLQNLHVFFSIILQNLSCIIFSVTMREEGRGVRDEALRGEGLGRKGEGYRLGCSDFYTFKTRLIQ